MKRLSLLLLLWMLLGCRCSSLLLAQTPSDSCVTVHYHDTDSCATHRFNPKQLILPVALTGIGVIGLESDWLKYQNGEMRDELQENIDRKITIDDFTQYVPAASVYALDLLGIKAKHNLCDRTVLLATSALLMGVTVNGLKYTTRVMRPDGTTRNSFPSGHTAMAFMGAEFLRREYQDVSPWIGVAGYAVATGTGFFRMYNNRHWFTDVVAGAGIGILSTEVAYWMLPTVQKHLYPKHPRRNRHTTFTTSPFLSPEGKGVNLVVQF